ncbi:hypothetical protein G5I_06556 [Acromyrmex echinatior]|uniref:Uncharacterized protein n=1 Tax=Acromyrmex echinatior TaxID=103372 RepID=F4WLD1_ACREC|nr:hypothetical protein G5I_06556 [Acromyrmex echinatior]
MVRATLQREISLESGARSGASDLCNGIFSYGIFLDKRTLSPLMAILLNQSIHANVHNYMDRSIVTWLLLARRICQWRNQNRKKCKGMRTVMNPKGIHHDIRDQQEKYFKLYPCIVTITKIYVREIQEHSRSALGYKACFLMFTPLHPPEHPDYDLYMSITLKRVSTNDRPIAHAIIIYDEMVNVENNSWQNGCEPGGDVKSAKWVKREALRIQKAFGALWLKFASASQHKNYKSLKH